MVCDMVSSVGLAATRFSRSRIPSTGCLPAVLRSVFSFFDSCLLALFAADMGFVYLDFPVHADSLDVESLAQAM